MALDLVVFILIQAASHDCKQVQFDLEFIGLMKQTVLGQDTKTTKPHTF